MLNRVFKSLLTSLKKHDLYYKVRFKKVPDMIATMVNPDRAILIRSENTLYRNLLSGLKAEKELLVFDTGASLGQLTEVFLEENCRVIAVEPDEDNCRILRLRFGNTKDLLIIEKGVSDQEGQAVFYKDTEGHSLHTLISLRKTALETAGKVLVEKKIRTTTLSRLFKDYGLPHLLKLDIEGMERRVLLTLTHPVEIIVYECNLPDYRQDGIDIINHILTLDKNYTFNFFDGTDLIFKEYQTGPVARKFLDNTDKKYLDVICKRILRN